VTTVLTADSIAKSYRGRRVLSAATLHAVRGAITVLLGRNGVGKSTLLKVAAGVIRADSGWVRFDEVTYLTPRLATLARAGLFYLPDRSALVDTLSVRRQLAAIARWSRRTCDPAEEVAMVADSLDISGVLDRRPGSLSMGEQRRTDLAAVLLRQPTCLLADEPYRDVAPRDRETLSRALRALADSGCAIVVTGHEIATLSDVADSIVWCVDGTTRPLGTPDQARADWQFVQRYLGQS
jgi:lipopolysaccharide export system ATP-binding protein